MKKAILLASLFVILTAGAVSVKYTYSNVSSTYGGEDNAAELYENPEDYDLNGSGSVADIIVKENLEKTNAANNVAAVVFDVRGYDTLGESFILLTAIAGTYVIMSISGRKKGDGR